MKTRFLVIMGVSGCGKSTIGQKLAGQLGWDFFDADDFHPPQNIEKMANGIPLNDADRAPWLDALHKQIAVSLRADRPGILACSALKERYRRQLLAGNHGVKIIYLKGTYELIWVRMNARPGHYMKEDMLQSQFDTLEEPQDALTVDITPSVDDIVATILTEIF